MFALVHYPNFHKFFFVDEKMVSLSFSKHHPHRTHTHTKYLKIHARKTHQHQKMSE